MMAINANGLKRHRDRMYVWHIGYHSFVSVSTDSHGVESIEVTLLKIEKRKIVSLVRPQRTMAYISDTHEYAYNYVICIYVASKPGIK